ncbi:MAG: type 1 glutamine amidotransferase [Candidatus Omnitrophica bacterium]|nr:type 1 glutamine amidotransferase [Candidatus Omnitrophota bacterium]
MPKSIALLVEDQYQVLEVWYPWLRLRENGIDVQFIGSGTKNVYGSKEGYPVKADKSIADVRADQFDGVIVPGGFAPDFMRRVPRMAQFVREIYDQNKIVAAICHGGWMLVSAGILKGKKATSFFAIKDDLIAAGAEWSDQEVVVDRNLITARKPEDLTAFTVEIIKQLKI